MTNLGTDDMIEVGDVFISSFNHVLNNYSDEAKADLLVFAMQLVTMEKPYMLVTEEGIQHIVAQVFGKEHYRDFIMMLAFTFFARFGRDRAEIEGLASNLARGATLACRTETTRVGLNAVPQSIRDRLPNMETVRELLLANPWLTIVLLIQLFSSIKPPAKVG